MTTTTDTLTPARLAEIRARAEKATPGPWKWANHDCAGGLTEWIEGPDGKCVPGIALFDCFYFEPQGSNAAFIAHARTDIPALLSAVEALQAEVATARDTAAREMREACAAACDIDGTYGPASGWTEEQAGWWDTGVVDGSAICRDRIRALPLPSEKERGS